MIFPCWDTGLSGGGGLGHPVIWACRQKWLSTLLLPCASSFASVWLLSKLQQIWLLLVRTQVGEKTGDQVLMNLIPHVLSELYEKVVTANHNNWGSRDKPWAQVTVIPEEGRIKQRPCVATVSAQLQVGHGNHVTLCTKVHVMKWSVLKKNATGRDTGMQHVMWPVHSVPTVCHPTHAPSFGFSFEVKE